MHTQSFFKSVMKISVPVALQCMLQSSFSIIDQLMIGGLGRVSVAAVGIAGKFSSLFTVVIGAIAAVAGMMMSQYIGTGDEKEVERSFSLNTVISVGIALIFTVLSLIVPNWLMGLYSNDSETIQKASEYLVIIAIGFLPSVLNVLISTFLRCMEKASWPLYFSIGAAVVNTGLNYILIFGKLGFVAMGINGAATATVISQFVNVLLLVIGWLLIVKKKKERFTFSVKLTKMNGKQYLAIFLPILVTEFLWSLGENVYASIYGHIGTQECAAMTLTYPIQGLMIGALSGIAQASGILIGKELGKKDYQAAYQKSKQLILYGLTGSLILTIMLILLKNIYVGFYNVENYVQQTAAQILLAFAIISPVKVENMILGGGILRSGCKTKMIMVMDTIGTWCFGVPLGLLTAFVFKLPIAYVYFILSLEECVRLLIAVVIFKRKSWMQTI